MGWLYYLIEANVYLSVFLALYHFFLKRETRYVLNRWYLLTTSSLAFLLPFLSISYLKEIAVPISTGLIKAPLYEIPSVVMKGTSPTQLQALTQSGINLDLEKLLLFLYATVVFVLLFNLGVNLYKIIAIYSAADKKKEYNITYVKLEHTRKEIFSFFNWLFLHRDMYKNQVILAHEKTHIKQGHSYDVLFFELLRCFNWFNPLAYKLVKDVKLNHEYIADQAATKLLSNKYDYANLLIQYAYIPKERLSHSAFTTTQLEQRIKQLARSPSKKSSVVKYLTILPIIVLLFFIAAFKVEKSYGVIHIVIGQTTPQKRFERGLSISTPNNQIRALTQDVLKPTYEKDVDSLKGKSIAVVSQLTSELINGPRMLDQIAEKLAREGKKLYARDYMLHWTINHANTHVRKVTHGVLSGTEAQLFRGELADTLYIDNGFYKIKDNVVSLSTDNLMISYADGMQSNQKKLIVIDALQRKIVHSLSNVDVRTKGTIYKVEVNPDFGYVKEDKLVDSLAPKYVDMKAANAKFPYIMVSFNSRVREAKVTANEIITNETNLPKEDPWQPGIIW